MIQFTGCVYTQHWCLCETNTKPAYQSCKNWFLSSLRTALSCTTICCSSRSSCCCVQSNSEWISTELLWLLFSAPAYHLIAHFPPPTPQQYLDSVRPLLVNDEYNQMVALANEFKDSQAAQLQRYLILKSWWATNYVSSVQNLNYYLYAIKS